MLVAILTLAVLWAGVMSALLWRYRRRIRHIIKELRMKEETDSRILLDSVSAEGDLSVLVSVLNRLLAAGREREEALRREARSYRESITSISHDIRTPLTSAKGYVQLMGDPAVTEEKRREYAEIVAQRLDALNALLDQLFLYARLQAKELPLKKERINAANLLAETVSMFYDDFVKKGCEPEIRLPKEPCLITGDREASSRIVENLVKNALVHGCGDYCFSLEKEENRAVLRVSNRTMSIEPRDVERVFDRFYTTDTSRSQKNTGLGLSIVKALAEQMGGEVQAGLEGEVFWVEVRLPYQQEKG